MKGFLNLKDNINKYSRVILSVLSAFVLLVGGYVGDNLSLFTREDLTVYSSLQFVKNWLCYSLSTEEHPIVANPLVRQYMDSALFVNVGYDRQLADYYSPDAKLLGNASVTNREYLYDFLKYLNSSNEYRYLILDVRFEKGKVTSTDSLLFGLIKEMRGKIVVPKHIDADFAYSFPEECTAYADYKSTIISTNLVRYPFIQNEECSLPLYAFKEITHNNEPIDEFVSRFRKSLCYKSRFLTFDIDDASLKDSSPANEFPQFDSNGQKFYYNLRSDLLDSPEDIEDLTHGKIIVVGDFVADMHDTYVGKKPGSLILYRALVELLSGEQHVKWSRTLCLFVLYFIMSLHLFRNHSKLNTTLQLYRKIPMFYFCFTFVGYGSILILFDSIWFLCFNEVYGLLFQSWYFPILKNIINYTHSYE